ncbi:protein bric-a-brac 1-like isoform X2 [Leptidea sinapis]|uniref:protein bric-a-brac 1-like isoform X2 n=1 Tax=Leptidea sinapis TaxID=189913 RepID=UPI0021C347AF|nr:protein bric-a-brac 1-like isoform X2 [Leptidea sinapis]
MPAEEDCANMDEQGSPDAPQQFCLRWNNYQSNLTSCFDQLLQTETLVDVTLACDGKKLKAHKVVLSACSPYFQSLFTDNPSEHPIVFLQNIVYTHLRAIVDFMYRGEVNVLEDDIPGLLKVAEALKVRGLTDINGEHSKNESGQKRAMNDDPAARPPKSRRAGSADPSPRESPRVSPMTPSTEILPPPEVALPLHADDADIRPGIAEMIREEERAKILENSHAWLGASTSSLADTYQYQLQSIWQKCWNTNQSLVHNLRFRERGPLKSWRPETMAEAIFSVLKEGLSLSQAARKYDIPYPTFVLYANRVHNMLGPSADGGTDLRPKGRGRPQRILLGVWPDEHIRGVIRAVVFRDSHATHAAHAAHHIKEEVLPVYPQITDGLTVGQSPYPVGCGNGREGGVSPNAAAAAAVAAVAHGLRRQMCTMVVAAQRPGEHPPHLGMPPLPMQSPRLPSPRLPSPRLPSPLSTGMESPLCSPAPPGHALEPPKSVDPFRPFVSPRPDHRYRERDVEITDMGPPKTPMSLAKNGKDLVMPVKLEPAGEPRADI